MLSDSYFDQLNTCDNDVEILTRLIKILVPSLDDSQFSDAVENTFNGIHGILSANYSKLKANNAVGENVAICLKYIQSVLLRTLKYNIRNKDLINNISDLNNYLLAKMPSLKDEFLFIFLMNSKNYLIKEEIISSGTTNEILFHPMSIIKKIVDANASSFILVHNHPSGCTKPSRHDIESTIALNDICNMLSISFHDHVIVGGDQILSMRQQKYM